MLPNPYVNIALVKNLGFKLVFHTLLFVVISRAFYTASVQDKHKRALSLLLKSSVDFTDLTESVT